MMRSARTRWLGMVLGLSALSTGCLVTDKPEFGEPNTPASVRPLSPRTLTRAPVVPDVLCGADKNFMGFEVEILDANVADSLEARLYVNGQYEAGRRIPSTGQISRGKVRLCAQRRKLLSSCSHVELVVSSAFGGQLEFEVLVEGDIGKAEWWVLPPVDEAPMAVSEDCIFDGGLP